MAHNTETFEATCSSAWGTPCEKFAYEYTAKQYPTWADAMAAGDGYTDEELLVKKNADLKNSASATERDRLLVAAGHVKPTTDNSAYLRLVVFYKMLRKSGKTHDEAVKLAATNAGEPWPEEPKDGSIKWQGKKK